MRRDEMPAAPRSPAASPAATSTGPTVVATLRFLRALAATSQREAFANRAAFWMQVAFMLMNDLIWFSTWWIVFARFAHIGGWTLADMAVLYAVLCGAVGLSLIVGGGVREFSRTISDGALDVFLAQPKSALLHALGSRTSSSGWGDLANSVVMLGVSGHFRLETLPLFVVAILLSAIVFLSFGVLVHSLAFWLGPVNTLARQVWEFVISFSLYPDTIFPGALRIVLFSAIPAAFVGWFPSGLVRQFTWSGLGLTLAGAAAFPLAAALVFHLGLRRYASGNRVDVRA